MRLSDLRGFAKRMGGDVPLVVELTHVDGNKERVAVERLMAERTQEGETLVLAIDKEEE